MYYESEIPSADYTITTTQLHYYHTTRSTSEVRAEMAGGASNPALRAVIKQYPARAPRLTLLRHRIAHRSDKR